MRLTKNENNYWEVRFKRPDGKIVSISTHRKNRKDAVHVIKQGRIEELELAAEIGALTPNVISALVGSRKMTVEEAIEPWKEWMAVCRFSENTINNNEMWLRAWAAAVNVTRKPLMMVTEKDLDPWVNSTTSSSKMATRKVMLSALRSYFKYAAGKGWCVGNPASIVDVDPFPLGHTQKETEKKPLFTDEEICTLMNDSGPAGRAPSEFWHAAIAIGRHTGLRLGDICCLEWACLEVPGVISVWTQKRDRRVELPLLPDALRDALLSVPRNHPVYMFPRERDMILDPKRRSVISNQFLRRCRSVGIFGKSFHGIRATYITDCDRRGIPLLHIARAVGHSNPATTAGYVRIIGGA